MSSGGRSRHPPNSATCLRIINRKQRLPTATPADRSLPGLGLFEAGLDAIDGEKTTACALATLPPISDATLLAFRKATIPTPKVALVDGVVRGIVHALMP